MLKSQVHFFLHKPLTFLGVVFLLISSECYSQKEGYNWYFGGNAAITFASGAPVAVAGGALNTLEGCSSISDKNGNLLFYTDGQTVYNKNNVAMPNGLGLNGNSSSTQSALIVQLPNSNTIYYIFTTDAFGGPNGFEYSIVDMSLAGGLGNVTSKNVLVYTNSCEKIAAVKQKNGCDIWIIIHQLNNSSFNTYSFTSTGLNVTPVVSTVGSLATYIGYMKASPDGKRLAQCFFTNQAEVYDFNNATGIVSNAITLTAPNVPFTYGLEFSPDATRLYLDGEADPTMSIYQFNLAAGSAAAINASITTVGATTSAEVDELQIGPDQKIYCARYFGAYLGVINSPNTLGVGCNYVDNGVSLGSAYSQLGLPDFVSSYFIPPAAISVDATCAGSLVTFTLSDTSNVKNFDWNFNDPSSGTQDSSFTSNPTHTFNGVGSYNVFVIRHYNCKTDTVKQTITMSSCGVLSSSASKTDIKCHGASNGIAVANPIGGTPGYTYIWSNGPSTQTVSGLAAGPYTVTITDAIGNTSTSSVTINEPSVIAITTTTTSASCGLANGSATASPTGGTGTYTYIWTGGATAQTAKNLAVGTYTVTVKDANGCTQTSSASITQPTTMTVSSTVQIACWLNGNTTLCNGSLTAIPSNGVSPYTYSWNNGQTSATATGLCVGNHTVTVTDAGGCAVQSIFGVGSSSIYATTTKTDISCNGLTDGTATVNPTATPPYTISWSLGASAATSITALPQGTYTVTVTDVNNCVITSTAVINDPPQLTATTSTAPDVCGGGGSATATPGGGTPGYTYSWSGAATGQTASNLPAATYTLQVTDANGCTTTITALIGSVNTITPNAGADQDFCVGDSVQLNASGGKTYSWLPGAGLSSTSIANPIAKPLLTTTYTVSVTQGTCSGVDSVVVTVDPIPTVTAGPPNDTVTQGQSTIITAGGGVSYSWTPATWLNNASIQDPIVTPLVTTTYTVKVTDAHGCMNIDSVTVYVKELICGKVYVPTAFSPNADGENDVLYVRGNCIKTLLFVVYDRWGERVFETTDQSVGWDGHFRGAQMDTGVFVFYLSAVTVKNEKVEIKGNVTLLR